MATNTYFCRYREPRVYHQTVERPTYYSGGRSRGYYADDMAIEPYVERVNYGRGAHRYRGSNYVTEYVDDLPPVRGSRHYDRADYYDDRDIVYASRGARDRYEIVGGDRYDKYGWSRSNKYDRYGGDYYRGGGYLRRSRSDPSLYGGY